MTSLDQFVTQHDAPSAAQLPPGPRMPAALQTVLFLVFGPYTAGRWQRRYGDVFSMHVAPAGRAVVLSRPEHIREVFGGPADVFHAGEGNAILGPIMGEHSVLLLDEDAHRDNRKRVMAAFRGESVASWGPVLADIAAAEIATWPTGEPFAVHPRMNDISLEAIMRIVFGLSEGERLDRIRPLLQALAEPADIVDAVRARRGGTLLELDRLLLNSPPFTQGWNAHLKAVRTQLAVDPLLRELAICAVAVLNEAEYEYVSHMPYFEESGGSTAQAEAIRDVDAAIANTVLFDEGQRATLRLAKEMTRDVKVRDATFEAVASALGDTRAVVELVGTIATYNMVSRFLVALELHPA